MWRAFGFSGGRGVKNLNRSQKRNTETQKKGKRYMPLKGGVNGKSKTPFFFLHRNELFIAFANFTQHFAVTSVP